MAIKLVGDLKKVVNVKRIIDALASPVLIIVAGVLLRLAPHEPNVAPISALALFGGAYLSKKYALILPLIVMIISDLFLGFHATIGWVYGSFILIGCIGLVLRKYKHTHTIILSSLSASLLFYLITNFGVWISGNMYPHNGAGLMESYAMGLPFLKNTVLGDLFYTGLFFGGYELLTHYLKSASYPALVKTSDE